MDSQKGRVVEKNYICTVVSHHGNLPQNHGLGFFFVLFLSFGLTSQHHFQVQETKRVIIFMTDIFSFFSFFFSLQVLTGGLRSPNAVATFSFQVRKQSVTIVT